MCTFLVACMMLVWGSPDFATLGENGSHEEPSLESLLEHLNRNIPKRGATAVRFRASHPVHRGESWCAIDWETLASSGTNGIGFGGTTLDGRRFSSIDGRGSWRYYDEDEKDSHFPFERSRRAALSGLIPAFGLESALSVSPTTAIITRLPDGRLSVRTQCAIPDGFQDMEYLLDDSWRVVEVRPGEPVPAFPTRYEYDDGAVETGAQAIPLRRIEKLTDDEEIVFVRTDFRFEKVSPPEWFTPERARLEMASAGRHMFAIPVHENTEDTHTDSEDGGGGDDEIMIATRKPGKPVGRSSRTSVLLIVLGSLLVLIALVATIRRWL